MGPIRETRSTLAQRLRQKKDSELRKDLLEVREAMDELATIERELLAEMARRAEERRAHA